MSIAEKENKVDGPLKWFGGKSYPSDLYESAAMQNGWRHVDFDLPNNAAGGKSKARETERVWMNFAANG